MGEQLKEQTLFDVLEANSKNIFWVDRYVSGLEGSGGTYESRRMTQQQLIDLMQDNLNFNTGVKIFKNNTGFTIQRGSLNLIDSPSGGVLTAGPMQGSNQPSGSKLYVAMEDILNGNTGSFIEEGTITNFDSSSFAVGDYLYWKPSTETIDNVAETDKVFLGIVLTSNVLGTIYVSPTRNYSLVTGSTGEVALFIGTNHIESNSRFTFVDNVGTEVGFRFNDGAGNLTQIGCTYANIESEGLASNSVLRLANWADNTNSGIISFRKARGSKASPTQVLANDVIGRMLGAGQHDNGSGTTTFEALVVAKENYVTDFIGSYPEIFRYALTEFQLLLAGSSDNSYFNPPFPNNLVFSVDGDGLVKFKNYQFPIADGTANQFLKTDGAGVLSWGTPSTPNLGVDLNRIPFGNSSGGLQDSIAFVFSPSSITEPFYNRNTIQLISYQADEEEGQSFIGSMQIRQNSTQSLISTNQWNNITDLTKGGLIRIGVRDLTFGLSSDALENQVLGQIEFGTGQVENGAVIRSIIEQDSVNGLGSKLEFLVTALNSNTPVLAMKIDNTGKVYFKNYSFPIADGAPNQIIQTDGAGNLTWVNNTGGGGGGGSQFIPHLQGNETFRGVTHRSGVVTTDASGGYTINISGAQFARTLLTTNYLTRQVVSSYSPTATATGAYGCIRGSSALFSISGGFYFTCDYGIADSGYAVGTHNFVGLTSDLTTLSIGSSLNNQPSALTNIIAMASDSGDANMQIMHNDISGVATKIDLGSSFPSNRTAGTALTTLYVVEFYNAPATTSVKYRVTNKESGAVATGTLTTNLPSTSNTLTFQVGRSMGTSAGGVNNSAVYCVGKVGFFNI